MEEQIKIYVHTNSTKNQKIIYVNKSDLIGWVFNNDDSKMIIFDGKILSFSFSFGFFGIVNGSHLYVLTTKGNKMHKYANHRRYIPSHFPLLLLQIHRKVNQKKASL